MIFFLVISFLFMSSAFALGVVEELDSRFVVRDTVFDFSPMSCADGGVRLVPENVFYVDDTDLPYRVYRVALPDSMMPSVAVRDLKTKKILYTKYSVSQLKIDDSDDFIAQTGIKTQAIKTYEKLKNDFIKFISTK